MLALRKDLVTPMSSDNYYLICAHPDGGYAAAMGFMSDNEPVAASADNRSFSTIAQAGAWAEKQDSEYAVALSGDLVEEHRRQLRARCEYSDLLIPQCAHCREGGVTA